MEAPRRSRARERHERRKARRNQERRSSKTSRRSIQRLRPLSDRDLPKVDLKVVKSILLGLAALVFMGMLIIIAGLLKNDPVEPDRNAIWIGSNWTYEPREDSEVYDLVKQLRNHEIGTIYAHVSELNLDNTWTGQAGRENQFIEVEQSVRTFALTFKEAYPNSQLYGTLTVLADFGEDGYRLDEEQVQEAIASFSSRVVNSFGFDGVLLNVEPVWNGDEEFLDVLRRVRQSIGDSALLAVAIPPDWTPEDTDVPTPQQIAPGTVWDARYKQRIVLIQVDQIVMRAYNSYLTRADEYADWIAYQVGATANAISSLDADVELVISVPTHTNALPAHDVLVENLGSAIVGVKRGLSNVDQETAPIVSLGIYAEWDTEDSEWNQFRDLWLSE